MSFNQKKTENNEIDDLNIKSHLNTSLETSGISVSEDLINRTLLAIKNQEAQTAKEEEPVKEDTGKVIPWGRYIRNFATVAAAAVILVVGINSLPSGNMKSSENTTQAPEMKKEQTSNSLMEANEDTAAGSSDAAAEADTADKSKTTEFAQQFSASTKEDTEDSGATAFDVQITAADEAVVTGEAPSIMAKSGKTPLEGIDNGTSAEQTGLSALAFRDICPIVPEAAESVSITKGTTSVFLSERADIDEFFNLFTGQSFTEGADSTGVNVYTVDIKSSGASFAMRLEESNIVTTYTYGNEVTEGRYIASDHRKLLDDLETMFQRYNK